MKEYITIIIALTFSCVISSVIGAVLGLVFSRKKKENLSSIYYFTAGVMNSIVCFEMIPEAIESVGNFNTIIFLLFGIILINLLEMKKGNSKINVATYIMIIAMASHNILEGIVIGTGFYISIKFGLKIFLTMFIHDIPESMAVFIVNDKGTLKAFFDSIIVGVVTVIGVVIGMLIGSVNESFNGYIISMASGAMLYVVSCTLIPKSFENKSSSRSYFSYIIGIILGIIIKNM